MNKILEVIRQVHKMNNYIDYIMYSKPFHHAHTFE